MWDVEGGAMKPANSLIRSYETATSRKFQQRLYMAVTAILLFVLVSCAGERDRSPGFAAQALQSTAEFLFGATCGDFYLDDMSSTFSYSLDSVTAGETTGLSVFMTFPNEVTMPILTTYQVVITVPPDFTFLGFDALGTGIADSIGAWDFDFVNPDGVFDNPDFTIVHRGINSTSAYSDQDDSGDFTPGIDPTADYTMGGGGEHIITLILPDGGIEQATKGLCSYFAFDARSAREIWTTDHNSELARDGGHGEYNRHPTIVDKTIYAWPYAYELKTGDRVEGWKFNRMGHGCGGVSASANGRP